MEEKQILHSLKIGISPKLKIKKRSRYKKNKDLIIASASIAIIILFIFIMLIIENRNLKRKLNSISYYKEKTMSINLSKQKFVTKFLFDKRDDYYDIIHKNIIHISYSLDDKEVYPTFISMISGLENCNKDNFIVYHLLLSYKFNLSNIEIFESLKEKYQVKINYFNNTNIYYKYIMI